MQVAGILLIFELDRTFEKMNDSPWEYYEFQHMKHIQTKSGLFICPVTSKDEAIEILAHHDMDLLINMPVKKRRYYVTNRKE